MGRYHSYLNSAKDILSIYRGEEPFSSFLKKYFAANKKFGSKDRKHVANLCYCFFRMGKAVMNVSFEDKILTGLFLCSDKSNQVLEALRPGLNEKVSMDTEDKYSIFNTQFSIINVFPWKDQLNEGIDHEKFCRSFFIQPDVFLRVRPGEMEAVIKKLQIADCRFKIVGENSLAFTNAVKLEDILEIDKEVVIQDLNSQRTGEILKSAILNLRSKISVWDCCAASGGKSIMAYDINPNIELTVSDVRESILANLRKRFERAGIKKYNSFVVDLASEFQISNFEFQIIIADVPCSGSGTWSRTPEQLYFFNEEKIEKYSMLQKKIVSNAIPHLKSGGFFVYITCSVFKKENEEIVEYIKEKFHLHLSHMEVLKGYDKKADSMFITVFEKRS